MKEFSFKDCYGSDPHSSDEQVFSQRTYKLEYSSGKNQSPNSINKRIQQIKKKYNTPSRYIQNQNPVKLNLSSINSLSKEVINQGWNSGAINKQPLSQVKNNDYLINKNKVSKSYYEDKSNQRPYQNKNNIDNEIRDKMLNERRKFVEQKKPIEKKLQPKYESRLQNIQRINSKIKLMFDDKDVPKMPTMERAEYLNYQSRKASLNASFDKQIEKRVLQTVKNSQLYLQSQKSSQNQVNKMWINQFDKQKDNNLYQKNIKKNDFYNATDYSMKKVKQFQSQAKIIKQQTRFNRINNTYDRKQEEHSKSKKYLNSVKKQLQLSNIAYKQPYEIKKQANKKDQKRNIDHQISKIQAKIKQFQEQKKKLNIQFKPYSFNRYDRSADTKRLNSQDQKVKGRLSIEQYKIKQSSQYKQKPASIIQKQTRIAQNIYEKINLEKPPLPKDRISYRNYQQNKTKQFDQFQDRKVSQFKIKLIPIEVETNIAQSNRKELQTRQTITNGIQQRKKRLKSTSQLSFSSSNQVKRLVNLFCDQAKLDQNLRNAKLWIQSLRDSSKWQKLKKQLEIIGIVKSQSQIQKQLSPSLEQNNPFFTLQNCQQSFKQVAKKYKAANQHWQDKILMKFSHNQLGKENFYNKCIDLEKKGYFVLEDLVRYLNMETGTFFRNRDLYLIFRRFTKLEKGDYETIIKVLCFK